MKDTINNSIDSVYLLQNIIRYDTTNPPGNEAECLYYIQSILDSNGIKAEIYSDKNDRANLVAKLKGKGTSEPLLLYGHIDVVTSSKDKWKYPPFSGEIAEGCVWGRGAVDMKGGIAMMLSAILRLKAEGIEPPGDIVLTILSDEEGEGLGVKHLINKHSEVFNNIKYAIGEYGGYTMHFMGKRFYPIMVAEKQLCSVKLVFRGKSGHGSIPIKDNAIAKLGTFIKRANDTRLPVHITECIRNMINIMAETASGDIKLALKKLLTEGKTDEAIEELGDDGKFFEPLLHNTINPTIIQGGKQTNVIPNEAVIYMDGRMLPGMTKEQFIDEIKELSGDAEISILQYDKGADDIDMKMFGTLSKIIIEKDTEGIPLPMMVTGVTDGRFLYKLGIQSYGFTPMLLEKNFDFLGMMHSENERIPIEALKFGTEAIYELLQRF